MDESGAFDADAFDPDEPAGIRIEVQHATRTLPIHRCRNLVGYVIGRERCLLRDLTLVLADHATVRELNRRYLDHDVHTDVLAFNYSDEDQLVEGEIYVDLDTASERCDEFGAGFEEEAMRYVIHGLLHVIGYSDRTPEGRQEMHALEDRYLTDLGY